MRHGAVALVTRDPSLYHELAGFLRERRLPSVSLLPGQRIPEKVVVVLTSAAERKLISHPNVLTVREGGDRLALGAAVEHALSARDGHDRLVIGIDPGPRPGYSVLSGTSVLAEGVLDSPESAGAFATHLSSRFSSRSTIFRVGAGDPPSRNRIVNALLGDRRSVELVREDGTTPHGRRRPRDAAAARTIAMTEGTPLQQPLPPKVTAGEVANLQRLSREGSGGRVTISRSCAYQVLRGELTLAEAVERTIPTSDASVGRPPSSRRRESI